MQLDIHMLHNAAAGAGAAAGARVLVLPLPLLLIAVADARAQLSLHTAQAAQQPVVATNARVFEANSLIQKS